MAKQETTKLTVVIGRETHKALKRYAVEQEVPAAQVVETALKMAIPEKYFRGPE